MIEDSADTRHRLSEAWRGIIRRTLDSGLPPAAVMETMFSVAVDYWAELQSGQEVANYLHLAADEIVDRAHARAKSLLNGQDETKAET